MFCIQCYEVQQSENIAIALTSCAIEPLAKRETIGLVTVLYLRPATEHEPLYQHSSAAGTSLISETTQLKLHVQASREARGKVTIFYNTCLTSPSFWPCKTLIQLASHLQ